MTRRPHWLPRNNTLRRQRRGAMIVMIAIMLVAFLVTLALSIDIAYMQLTRTELRTATDAAARAGAEALSREQDVDIARKAIKRAAVTKQCRWRVAES